MYSLRLSMLSGSGFAINVSEDLPTLKQKLSEALAEGRALELASSDGTSTTLVVRADQIDGYMHSPKAG